MSGSGLGDAARWDSRHLLQELFNTEIQMYIEPEKNCTDPGKSCAGLRRPERSSNGKPHRVWGLSGQSCVPLFDFGLKTCGTSFQIHTGEIRWFKKGSRSTNTPGNFCRSGGIKIVMEISDAATLLFLFTFTAAHFTRSSEWKMNSSPSVDPGGNAAAWIWRVTPVQTSVFLRVVQPCVFSVLTSCQPVSLETHTHTYCSLLVFISWNTNWSIRDYSHLPDSKANLPFLCLSVIIICISLLSSSASGIFFLYRCYQTFSVRSEYTCALKRMEGMCLDSSSPADI